MLESPECVFEVTDTQKQAGFFVHLGHLRRGVLRAGMKLTARVDLERRNGIRRAHSATHLLHHALQKTLGGHATQRGSRVENDLLRFDFTQPKAIPRETLAEIEREINARINEGAAVSTTLMNLEQARQSGATALFGEKYADEVRVVTMGSFSRELCGGTHLSNTGQVGLCKLVSEESVAAGTRRITALTGVRALQKIREDEQLLLNLAQQVKAPRVEDLPQRVEALLEELKTLKRELSKHTAQAAAGLVDELVANALDIGGIKVITHRCDEWDADSMRAQIDQLRRKASPLAVLLAAGGEGKVLLVASVGKELIDRGISAVDWVKASAKAVGGGGGGRPDLAQAGGKKPEAIPQSLADAVEYLRGRLK
jgi:alanyl-tRNA synthetase